MLCFEKDKKISCEKNKKPGSNFAKPVVSKYTKDFAVVRTGHRLLDLQSTHTSLAKHVSENRSKTWCLTARRFILSVPERREVDLADFPPSLATSDLYTRP